MRRRFPPRPRERAIRQRRLARLLVGCGALLLLIRGAHLEAARLFQARARAQLAVVTPAGAPAAPVGPAAPPGTPLGRLRVPRLGLDAMIAEGTSADVLARAVGHIEGTRPPGGAGSVGLAGHRDTFFRPLRGIRVADTLSVETRDSLFVYRVDSLLVVTPDAGLRLRDMRRPTLWLVTCYPFRYIGPAPNRLLVRASLLSPAARPAAAPR